MNLNLELLQRILNSNSVSDIREIALNTQFRFLLKSSDVLFLEIGKEESLLYDISGNKRILSNLSLDILQFENIFSKNSYLYHSNSNLFDFLNKKGSISAIPIVKNNTLTGIILSIDTEIKREHFIFIAKIIEKSVEKIVEKDLFSKINDYFKEIFFKIKSTIIIRDKNFNILFSNKVIDGVYKCFDLAFSYNSKCSFCPLKSGEYTHKIKNKSYKIEQTILNKENYLCIVHDISSIINLQEELSKSEKLSLLGKISSEIAHEIKNPLNAMKLKVTLLKKKFAENSITESIEKEIERLNNIINEYFYFGRSDIIEKGEVSLNKVIYEVVENFSEELSNSNIKIEVNFHKDIDITIQGDKGKLKQVFVNLLKNSIEALQCILNSDKKISISMKRLKNSIVVDFKDNGYGINNPEKLFTPFYTTKEYGTGLGLVITEKNIYLHGGKIKYYRDKDSMTVFRITLPSKTNYPDN